MPAVYHPNAAFEPSRNVRDYSALAGKLAAQPTGPAWALVGARRHGKTWSLAGIENSLGAGAGAQVVTCGPRGWDRRIAGDVLLIDEPAAAAMPCGDFLDRCRKWKRAGRRVLIAMSPAEWDEYASPSMPAALRLHLRDRLWIEPLSEEEQRKFEGRAAWAPAVVAALAPEWRASPFLLELALSVAEESAGLRADPAALVRHAVKRAGQQNYVHEVAFKGLSPAQREGLRRVRRGEEPSSEVRTVLESVGLIASRQTAAGPAAAAPVNGVGGETAPAALADPVVASALPSPVRIDHLSDVHFGRKSANVANARAPIDPKDPLPDAVGAGPLARSYVRHVEFCPAPEKPHLAVVSGDLTETAAEAEFDAASKWLEEIRAVLARHECLAANKAGAVLVVGGNHDVQWDTELGGAHSRQRHAALLKRFTKYPLPELDQPAEQRKLARVAFDPLGVEFVFLGSAELGSELRTNDAHHSRLVKEIEDLRKQLMAAPDDDAKRKIRDTISRIDPGLVHHADLGRVRANPSMQPLRIAVLHHPVSVVPTGDFGLETPVLVNAAEAKQALVAGKTQLVLHGHLHTSFVLREEWFTPVAQHQLWISSAPSLASTEVAENHGFHRIEVLHDLDDEGPLVRVTIQPYRENAGQWSRQGAEATFAVRLDGKFVRE